MGRQRSMSVRSVISGRPHLTVDATGDIGRTKGKTWATSEDTGCHGRHWQDGVIGTRP